jgi:hypothetical protein
MFHDIDSQAAAVTNEEINKPYAGTLMYPSLLSTEPWSQMLTYMSLPMMMPASSAALPAVRGGVDAGPLVTQSAGVCPPHWPSPHKFYVAIASKHTGWEVLILVANLLTARDETSKTFQTY